VLNRDTIRCGAPLFRPEFDFIVVLAQLDVASSQLLVTDNDFRDPEFRQQLSETVNSLLALRVVPIFNENDAISTRKSPYQVLPNSFSCHVYCSCQSCLSVSVARCVKCVHFSYTLLSFMYFPALV